MAKEVEVRQKAYLCEKTGQQFKTLEEAQASERRHDVAREEEDFRKIFPLEHEKDTETDKHCVACGKKLLPVLTATWMNAGLTWGGIVHSIRTPRFFDSNDLFGGLWCHDCHKGIKKVLVRLFNSQPKG